MPEACEVKSKNSDTRPREPGRYASRSRDILGTGATMREKSRRQDRPVGQIKPRGEGLAAVSGKGDAFCGPGYSFPLAVIEGRERGRIAPVV